MGATPFAFTLALTLPTVTADWLQAYARGLNQMARACDVALVGGDTTRGPLSMTLTVFGRVPSGMALTRGGPHPGDWLRWEERRLGHGGGGTCRSRWAALT